VKIAKQSAQKLDSWCKTLKAEQLQHLKVHCLWKEILSQQRIRHLKILQSIYFAYDIWK